jgi:hypothetical protein
MQTMFQKRTVWSAVGVAAVLFVGPSHAALFDRGGGMIYDDTLNITWLKDWNRAGREMYLGEARAWADKLRVGGYDDWRLPTLQPINGSTFQYDFSNNGSTDFGYAKTGVGWGTSNELGHMFYVTLGNKGRCTPNDASPGSCVEQPGWGFTDTGPFNNVEYFYWSVLEHPPSDQGYNWGFYEGGYQQEVGLANTAYAVAVRPGDVAMVPEPQTYALLMLGLGAVMVAVRRRGV